MKPSDHHLFWNIQRNAFIELGRSMNTFLDSVFYDMPSLTSEEKSALSNEKSAEGSVLIVYPGNAARAIDTLTPLEFITDQKKQGVETVDAIAVPGVGSSKMGTAALARNVANAINRPVAGIVSGLGMADLLSEAMGGWFVLGYKNTMRDMAAKFFDLIELKDHVWEERSYRSLVKDENLSDFDLAPYMFGSPDATALLLTLYHLRKQITLLVGHSKGDYMIENALEGMIRLCQLKKEKLPDQLKIVTLGAVVRFPEAFEKNAAQFIGTLDGFGLINSRLNLNPMKIEGAWHSLNTALPGHLSVEKAVQMANEHFGAIEEIRPAEKREAEPSVVQTATIPSDEGDARRDMQG